MTNTVTLNVISEYNNRPTAVNIKTSKKITPQGLANLQSELQGLIDTLDVKVPLSTNPHDERAIFKMGETVIFCEEFDNPGCAERFLNVLHSKQDAVNQSRSGISP